MIETSVFQSWLAKELGRAAVFLQEHNASPYLDTLLDACTHSLTYDAQCEDERTPYLWRLIELSKHQAFFQNQVWLYLAEKLDHPDEYEWSQLFGLARRFAGQGDAEMRRAMYSAFEELGFEKAGESSAQEFIELDGLDGFVFVAERFHPTTPEDELWEVRLLLSDLEERLGKERTLELLRQVALRNQTIAAILEAIQQQELKYAEQRAKARLQALPDYFTLKAQKAGGSWAAELRRWIYTATPEQIKVATMDLLWETDAEKIWGFLRAFNRRSFPGSPERLLELAEDERPRIRRAAVVALSNVSHPQVRSRALVLLNSADRFTDGARLLVSNYEAGDFRLLEDLLRQPLDEGRCHDLGFSIIYLLGRQLTPEAEGSLLLLYEKNPCSNCRERFVRFLLDLNRMPDWMRQECQYDANRDIIKAVL